MKFWHREISGLRSMKQLKNKIHIHICLYLVLSLFLAGFILGYEKLFTEYWSESGDVITFYAGSQKNELSGGKNAHYTSGGDVSFLSGRGGGAAAEAIFTKNGKEYTLFIAGGGDDANDSFAGGMGGELLTAIAGGDGAKLIKDTLFTKPLSIKESNFVYEAQQDVYYVKADGSTPHTILAVTGIVGTAAFDYQIYPKAEAEWQEKVYYSEQSMDRSNGLKIIPDGTPPDIIGMEAPLDFDVLDMTGKEALSFSLDAKLYKQRKPEETVFKAGDGVVLEIEMLGYAERLEVCFPQEFLETFPELDHVYEYEAPYLKNKETLYFNIPLKAEEKSYEVVIRAYRQGQELTCTKVLAIVKGNILDELRTRIRNNG